MSVFITLYLLNKDNNAQMTVAYDRNDKIQSFSVRSLVQISALNRVMIKDPLFPTTAMLYNLG